MEDGRVIRVKNWHEFQHYRDRRPPWIKLHRQILDDYDFHCLSDASRALAPCLWLLASEFDQGEIPYDVQMICFRLHIPCEKVEICLQELRSKGFILYSTDASAVLAERKQSAIPEVEVEREKEGEATSAPKILSVEWTKNHISRRAQYGNGKRLTGAALEEHNRRVAEEAVLGTRPGVDEGQNRSVSRGSR